MIGAVVSGQDSGLRLAELVAAFSLATDLGMGQPMEHVLRSWLIAVRLGERLDLGPEARVSLYYVMVLAWVGCVADTVEVFHRAGGVDAAVEVARARRGTHFDPEVVDLFCGAARDVLADMDAVA